MKKYIVALMVLVLALALVACGEPVETTEPVTEHVHAYAEKLIPATCIEVGKLVNKCECGEVQSETELPLADHTPSALDCEKDTVCTVCNAVLAEKTGHIYTNTQVVTAATCGTAGKESGSCISCGKVVENEIPATGHVAGASITMENGEFKTTCTICSQNVTLKAQTPAFLLDFEEDVVSQASKYDVGLAIFKSDSWKTTEFNGSNALKVGGNNPLYINIVDSTKLAALGTFVISFDYTTTKVPAANSPAASMISILNNHQDGKQTSAGSVGWGWLFKIVENGEQGVAATVDKADALKPENSIAVDRNVTYKVQIVISPASKESHAFINGTYIGTSNKAAVVSKIAPANASIRFGDGPDCGHVIDNFAISALK